MTLRRWRFALTGRRWAYSVAMVAVVMGALALRDEAFAASGSGPDADADPDHDAELIAIQYNGDIGCPPASFFESALAARTRRVRFVDASSAARRTLTLRAARIAEGSLGRLELRGHEGVEAAREVLGQTCAEVVSVLVFVAVLLLDPQASLDTAQSPAAAPAAAPSAAPPAAPPAARAIPGPSASVAPTAPGHSGPADERAASATAPSTLKGALSERELVPNANSWRLAVGADGAAVSGVFPDLAVAPSVFFELDHQRDSWLQPAVRLSIRGALSQNYTAFTARIQFRWVVAAVAACPFKIRLTPTLYGQPCALAEGGGLFADVSGVSDPFNPSSRWFALGGSARIRWLPGRRLFLEGEMAVRFPLARDWYVLQTRQGTWRHDIPFLGFEGGLAFGVWL